MVTLTVETAIRIVLSLHMVPSTQQRFAGTVSRVRVWLPIAMSICFASSFAINAAENALTETRSTLEKWVETRRLISKTKTDWQSDKELLEQSLALFDRELKTVEEQLSKLTTNQTQVDKERLQAESQLKSANDALDGMKTFAASFETELAKQIPLLPVPLQDLLKPLLARLPANPKETKMQSPERIQLLIAILNELDKFNNGIGIFSEKRRNAKGEDVAVETVYVGLGAAYFVNESGDFAGTGVPSATGWNWTPRPELASSIRDVIRIYRNEQPARFIALPASVQ